MLDALGWISVTLIMFGYVMVSTPVFAQLRWQDTTLALGGWQGEENRYRGLLIVGCILALIASLPKDAWSPIVMNSVTLSILLLTVCGLHKPIERWLTLRVFAQLIGVALLVLTAWVCQHLDQWFKYTLDAAGHLAMVLFNGALFLFASGRIKATHFFAINMTGNCLVSGVFWYTEFWSMLVFQVFAFGMGAYGLYHNWHSERVAVRTAAAS